MDARDAIYFFGGVQGVCFLSLTLLHWRAFVGRSEIIENQKQILDKLDKIKTD